MCGIAGAFRFGRDEPVPGGLVTAMCEDLRHRGPDGSGNHEDLGGRLRLGHTRLAIIDVAGGTQPMSTADGRLTVVFNGEIYNHLRLRDDLAHRAFRTRSDTEVVLHVYDEYGLDGLERLAGMFAFALWDVPRRRLVLARDRLGIKPLYWTVAGDTLAFASEVPPLLRLPGVARGVDTGALRYFLALRAVPAPLTLFRQIRKLPAGHRLVCEDGAIGEPKPFWSLAARPRAAGGDVQELADDLRRRIDRAVRDHMLSDVPVGALLSGGLDSSLIVGCMSPHAEGGLHTFSVGSSEPGVSELPHARRVAQRFGTRHHEHVLTPAEVVGSLPSLIEHFADPVADPAVVPLYALSAVIRRLGIKVILSGEGSDELFAGYPDYAERLAAARGWRGLARALAGGSPAYLGHAALPGTGVLRALLVCDEAEDFGILQGHRDAARAAGMDPLQTMLFLDLQTRIPEDLLARTDRVTMAHSIEARVPFLDHELVEHAFWMPSSAKIRGGDGKHVLKRAALPLLPADIVRRPKEGFPTPVRRWLVGPLIDVFRTWLLDVHEEPRCFDHAVLERLLAEHLSGARDWSLLLWRVWFFKVWHTAWVMQRRLAPELLPPAARVLDPERAGPAALAGTVR